MEGVPRPSCRSLDGPDGPAGQKTVENTLAVEKGRQCFCDPHTDKKNWPPLIFFINVVCQALPPPLALAAGTGKPLSM